MGLSVGGTHPPDGQCEVIGWNVENDEESGVGCHVFLNETTAAWLLSRARFK